MATTTNMATTKDKKAKPRTLAGGLAMDKPAKKPAAPAKPARKKAAKKPDVGGQIDRLQKRSRDLEDWQAEVEQALAVGLNILVGSKREDAEKAAADAVEFERQQDVNAANAEAGLE